MDPNAENRPSNFVRDIIERDLDAGTHGGRVALRFPPEPNGYPHLGHAKSICLNFGLAETFGGVCNLRYDDTNPETERPEFVAALEEAVRWLGFSPTEVLHTSDYFEQLYDWAVELINKGLAYVDSQPEEAIREGRGTVTEPGTPSPYRDRPAEESLRLLDEMRRGLHADGTHVLRAKITTPEHGPMAHPNMKLRDPIMYRIRRGVPHYRRSTEWSIYPLYDWAHGQSDAIEEITHSLCTLEFDVNRPLYNWYLDAIGVEEPRNHQIEFARFNLDYTVMSKRKLIRLVEEGHVAGWDDPRMPTIAGQRRRGVRPQAIRSFCEQIGVSKTDGRVELQQYEYALRDDLNEVAPRVMAVSQPVRLTIENLPEGETEWVDAPYWPHDVTPPEGAARTRRVPLTRELWIERDDFAETPPKGWRRLSPDAEVRLRHGYVIRCTGVEKDENGEIVALRAQADLATLGAEPEGRKVRGVIHWVSAEHGVPARFRLYDRLFREPAPDALDDFLQALNPESLVETEGFIEPSVSGDAPATRYQFERLGYFWRDPEDTAPNALVFNRIVALRDGWSKQAAPEPAKPSKPARPQPPAPPRDPAAGLTEEQRSRYNALVAQGVGEEEAAVLAAEPELFALLADTVAQGAEAREAAVLLVQELRPALGDRPLNASKASPESLAEVLRMVETGTLTRAAAREVVSVLIAEGGTAQGVVEARGLAAMRDDDALVPVVTSVIEAHPEEAERYRSGEKKLMGFFMGQAMREFGKGADAAKVRDLIRQQLEG